ncbi:MAG: hypothetical protein WDZ41_04540 [Candidatus Babeliales bacterium]
MNIKIKNIIKSSTILGLSLFIVGMSILKKDGFFYEKPVIVKQSAVFETPAKDYFLQKLENDHNQAWASLRAIGITKDRFQQAKKQHYNEYLRSDIPFSRAPVSPKTKAFVADLLKENGLTPQQIPVYGYTDGSPAAATDRIIYVNEKTFSMLSSAAKRFVIAHEIQHILNKDNSAGYIMEVISGLNIDKVKSQKNHPLLQFNRFKEKRADVNVAVKNKDWAKAYLAFTQEQFKICGDSPGITHPKNSERIALAQQIVDYMDGKQPVIKTA